MFLGSTWITYLLCSWEIEMACLELFQSVTQIYS